MRPPPQDPKHPKPHLTHTPWAGFSPREHWREEVLPLCPSPRCRRVRACVAAHDGLFCQRTHVSHEEHLDRGEGEPSFEETRGSEGNSHEALTQRWKAGEFDDLYGPWRARGVLMPPPQREFADLRGKPKRKRPHLLPPPCGEGRGGGRSGS
ncbi:MAG: hypothetical protein KGO53_13155 [Alphaproteobacteria bacterium]|nr:hypothetical protein [Alphaproteobacteria bacterium]